MFEVFSLTSDVDSEGVTFMIDLLKLLILYTILISIHKFYGVFTLAEIPPEFVT